jgi:hypothetical protein
MRLSEVLELPEFKKRRIALIGHWNTGETVVSVLAHEGEKVFPFPKLRHFVEDGPNNPDPILSQAEIDSILRHFGYFEAISRLPAK